ncbi:MAG: DUF1593 domain-containing protein [Cyclobacteriaceae bacterium]|nr:DUF1593 domain-containing protein [Cyclobacteriaceae bacterium]
MAKRGRILMLWLLILFITISITAKPRLIIMTDIGGGDSDDQQSMVRLMTLANKFDIEGLLACSTLTRKNATTTRPEVIAEIINTYRDVRLNLLIHEPGFPTKIFLLSQIKRRLANQFKIGKDYDTEASD